jgi:hypothetical protein
VDICLASLRDSDQLYGMTPRLVAEHDLGDTIPAEGLYLPRFPDGDMLVIHDMPKPQRTWTWAGQVMGG